MTVTGFGACGPLNGGFRIRVSALAPELARCGIELETRPLLTADEDRRFAAAPLARKLAIARRARSSQHAAVVARPPGATVVVHRQADLFPTRALERAIARGRRMLYDLDDAVWLNPTGRGRALVAPRKLRWLASHADCVLAGSDHLAEAVAPHAHRVVVVPSTVDPRVLPPRRHEQRDTVVVGWIGSPENAAYLEPVLPVLARVAAALAPRKVVLDLVGGRVSAPPGVSVRAVEWSLAAERAALARMDVGLMPLPATAWSAGKCGYKALLYQGAGIPVVADDVGVSRQVVRAGGFVVHGPREWEDALYTLLTDARERARRGMAGRREVAADYSVETWGQRIAQLLREESPCAS
jgi:glycosyltransferase involved in cell wall biosynthesis